jgi:hypothetical protein
VRHLEIKGPLSVNDVENLSSIECVLELGMSHVTVEQIYQLLESIGRCIKTLMIKNMQTMIWAPDVGIPIIVERILAACPNLQHFDLMTDGKVAQDDRYVLPTSAFKNYQK